MWCCFRPAVSHGSSPGSSAQRGSLCYGNALSNKQGHDDAKPVPVVPDPAGQSPRKLDATSPDVVAQAATQPAATGHLAQMALQHSDRLSLVLDAGGNALLWTSHPLVSAELLKHFKAHDAADCGSRDTAHLLAAVLRGAYPTAAVLAHVHAQGRWVGRVTVPGVCSRLLCPPPPPPSTRAPAQHTYSQRLLLLPAAVVPHSDCALGQHTHHAHSTVCTFADIKEGSKPCPMKPAPAADAGLPPGLPTSTASVQSLPTPALSHTSSATSDQLLCLHPSQTGEQQLVHSLSGEQVTAQVALMAAPGLPLGRISSKTLLKPAHLQVAPAAETPLDDHHRVTAALHSNTPMHAAGGAGVQLGDGSQQNQQRPAPSPWVLGSQHPNTSDESCLDLTDSCGLGQELHRLEPNCTSLAGTIAHRAMHLTLVMDVKEMHNMAVGDRDGPQDLGVVSTHSGALMQPGTHSRVNSTALPQVHDNQLFIPTDQRMGVTPGQHVRATARLQLARACSEACLQQVDRLQQEQQQLQQVQQQQVQQMPMRSVPVLPTAAATHASSHLHTLPQLPELEPYHACCQPRPFARSRTAHPATAAAWAEHAPTDDCTDDSVGCTHNALTSEAVPEQLPHALAGHRCLSLTDGTEQSRLLYPSQDSSRFMLQHRQVTTGRDTASGSPCGAHARVARTASFGAVSSLPLLQQHPQQPKHPRHNLQLGLGRLSGPAPSLPQARTHTHASTDRAASSSHIQLIGHARLSEQLPSQLRLPGSDIGSSRQWRQLCSIQHAWHADGQSVLGAEPDMQGPRSLMALDSPSSQVALAALEVTNATLAVPLGPRASRMVQMLGDSQSLFTRHSTTGSQALLPSVAGGSTLVDQRCMSSLDMPRASHHTTAGPVVQESTPALNSMFDIAVDPCNGLCLTGVDTTTLQCQAVADGTAAQHQHQQQQHSKRHSGHLSCSAVLPTSVAPSTAAIATSCSELPGMPPALQHGGAVAGLGSVATAAQAGHGEQQQQARRSECIWEVMLTLMKPPGQADPCLLVTCTDITTRAQVDRLMVSMMESQLSMVTSMFPLHCLQLMAAGAQADLSTLTCSHEAVSLLFMDIAGYTNMSRHLRPEQVMRFLNDLFSRFDALADQMGVHKMETVGDAYLAAVGAVETLPDGSMQVVESHDPEESAHRLLAFAKAMLMTSREVCMPHNGQPVTIRIGLHSGDVTTGIIGSRLPKFGFFGDAMNTASRMESTAPVGRIQVSAAMYALLGNSEQWEPTGGIEVKGKGLMYTYLWVEPPAAGAEVCGPALAHHSGPHTEHHLSTQQAAAMSAEVPGRLGPPQPSYPRDLPAPRAAKGPAQLNLVPILQLRKVLAARQCPGDDHLLAAAAANHIPRSEAVLMGSTPACTLHTTDSLPASQMTEQQCKSIHAGRACVQSCMHESLGVCELDSLAQMMAEVGWAAQAPAYNTPPLRRTLSSALTDNSRSNALRRQGASGVARSGRSVTQSRPYAGAVAGAGAQGAALEAGPQVGPVLAAPPAVPVPGAGKVTGTAAAAPFTRQRSFRIEGLE